MSQNNAKVVLRVLAFQVGQAPKDTLIENSLKDMQRFVGGDIQMVPFIRERRDLEVCCNDEGKFNEALKPNRMFGMVDHLVGDFFVTRTDLESGASVDLTDEDIEVATAWFHGTEL